MIHRRRIAQTVISLITLLGSTLLAQSQARLTVTWANDRLSVQADAAPLAAVMTEVARVSGLRVVGADKFEGTVSADFTNLTISDALKMLLADVNYFVQQETADTQRVALVVRVHSMAHDDGTRAKAHTSAGLALHVPAIDALVEAEEEDLADEKEEEVEDPDIERENQEHRHAARELALNGAFGETVSVAELQRHLSSENPEIRLEAVKALAERPIAASLAPLIKALDDDAIEVRRTAIGALGRVNDPGSLLQVGLMLEKGVDSHARYAALRVLALRADPAAIVHLQRMANDEDVMIRDAVAQMLAEFARLAREKNERPRPPHIDCGGARGC